MKILVACEESQTVTKAFRKLGHEAYSCDILPPTGGKDEWHIITDVLKIINGHCSFRTVMGEKILIKQRWDMIIAFPPCTHLAVSGARHFEKKREDGRQYDGIKFFMEILTANCDKLAVENPVNIISGKYIKKWFPTLCEQYSLPIPTSQIIQPYQFGHNASKKTCLWLKGLPLLKPTKLVQYDNFVIIGKDNKKYAKNTAWFKDENGKTISWSNPMTAKLRSKTFTGIAEAMAIQWGGSYENRKILH